MIKEYQRRPKSLNLNNASANPIVFATFNSSRQIQSQARTTERPRLTLSFAESDTTDDDMLEKQRSADITTFRERHVV